MVKFLTKKKDEERKKNTYFVSSAIFIKTTNENKIATPEFNSFAINSGFCVSRGLILQFVNDDHK